MSDPIDESAETALDLDQEGFCTLIKQPWGETLFSWKPKLKPLRP